MVVSSAFTRLSRRDHVRRAFEHPTHWFTQFSPVRTRFTAIADTRPDPNPNAIMSASDQYSSTYCVACRQKTPWNGKPKPERTKKNTYGLRGCCCTCSKSKFTFISKCYYMSLSGGQWKRRRPSASKYDTTSPVIAHFSLPLPVKNRLASGSIDFHRFLVIVFTSRNNRSSPPLIAYAFWQWQNG